MEEYSDGSPFLKNPTNFLLLGGGWKLERGTAHAFVNRFCARGLIVRINWGCRHSRLPQFFFISASQCRLSTAPFSTSLCPHPYFFAISVNWAETDAKTDTPFFYFQYVLSTWLLLCSYYLYSSRKDWLKYLFPSLTNINTELSSAFLLHPIPWHSCFSLCGFLGLL